MAKSLDLNLLSVLVAIDDKRSVSLAARSLNRSQPSVSSALGRLRRQYNDPLFLRTATSMMPTSRAVSVIRTARQILGIVDEKLASPAVFSPRASALPVRIALSDAGQIVFLPRILHLVRQEMPEALMQAVSLPAEAVAREMEAGNIDLAAGYFPDLSAQTFKQQVLFQDSYTCLIRADHRIRAEQLSLEQFRELDHAVVRAETRTSEVMERYLARHKLRRRIVLTTPHFASIPVVVAHSDLIVIVPAPLARHFATITSGVRIIRLPFKPPVIGLKQIWHRRFHHDPRNQWLRSKIYELFAEQRKAQQGAQR
jgi:DNA-binding transcriptional LysR family regulator